MATARNPVEWLGGLPAEDLLARAIYAEAGNQPQEGRAGVGHVIRNRARDGNIGAEILKPGQFSAFNAVTGYAGGEGANNLWERQPGPDEIAFAKAVLSGAIPDPTGGATHYYNPGLANPAWAKGKPYQDIGAHRFLSADAPAGGSSMAQPAGADELDFLPPESRRRVAMALGMPGAPNPIRPMGQAGPQMVNFTGPGQMQVASLLQQAAEADQRSQGVNNGTIPGGLASVLERIGGAVNRGRAMSADDERRKAIVESLGGASGGQEGPPDPRLAALDPGLYAERLAAYEDAQAAAAKQQFTAGENQLDRDARIEAAAAGKPETTINTGEAPDQYLYGTKGGVPNGWRVNRVTGEASVIPGGPADVEAQAEAAKERNKDRQSNLKLGTTLESLNLNIAEIENGGLPVTGPIGDARRSWMGRAVTGSDATDFANRTNQITDAAAFAEIQNMRDNSKTGGAVGQLTEGERIAIGNSVTALNNSTSSKEYLRAAKAYRDLALNLAYGEGMWTLNRDGTISASDGTAPAAGAVPPQAVEMLKSDPSPEAMREFDEMFGAGAAQRALGQ